MQVIHHEREYAGKGTVIALGTFDGVHIGHQKLIRTAAELAKARGLDSVVCTFDRHPLAVLRPGSEPLELLSLAEKLEKVDSLGADIALVLAFTREFAAIEAEDFLASLVSKMRAKVLVVGENYTFGRFGRGNSDMLRRLAPELGFEAVIVEPVTDGGEIVSSTRIRRLIETGDTEYARRLMGEA